MEIFSQIGSQASNKFYCTLQRHPKWIERTNSFTTGLIHNTIKNFYSPFYIKKTL